LADQIANLENESHNILQLRTKIYSEVYHILFGYFNKLRALEKHHV